VLAGKAEVCGLAVVGSVPAVGGGRRNDVVAPHFTLVDEARFCTPPCVTWATGVLPQWLAECPHNCDYTPAAANATANSECRAHASGLPQLEAWAAACPQT
jgi:hypothetical protein